MATKGYHYQAQAPATPPAGERANKAPTWSTPRRGQIKEKIIKDVVAAVASLAAVLVRADKNGAGGLQAPGDAVAK